MFSILSIIFDPLEQFDIINVCNWQNNLESFTLIIFLIIFILFNPYFDFYLLSNKNFFLVKAIDFIKGMIQNTLHIKKKYMFFFIFIIFMYILFCNCIGMIPYTFTVTSSLIVTFFLAATFFGGVNIISIYTNGWNFLNLFLPKGVPFIIVPFLVLIEILSYFSRVISLSVRLFANMMSGHTLIKILVGFLWLFFKLIYNNLYLKLVWYVILSLLVALIPWLIIMIVLILECAIAFLQAYVFVILIIIYLNDGINLH